MIDIHSHILPELDDGSFDIFCSLEMAEIAAQTGVTAMVATPHANQRGYFENYASQEITDKFSELKRELVENGTELELYLGMEVFGTYDAASLYRDGRILTLNGGRYMLVEFDFYADIQYINGVLYSLMDAGCVPVVAHPERYVELQQDYGIVNCWLNDGMAVQVNKGSLAGRFGRRAKKLAFDLLSDGLISCIASDAHGPQVRSPNMSDAYEFLTVEFSEETAELLLTENPRRIINSEPVIRCQTLEAF